MNSFTMFVSPSVCSEVLISMKYFFHFCPVYSSNDCHILDHPEAQTDSVCGEPADPQLLSDCCRSVQLPPASSENGSLCL